MRQPLGHLDHNHGTSTGFNHLRAGQDQRRIALQSGIERQVAQCLDVGSRLHRTARCHPQHKGAAVGIGQRNQAFRHGLARRPRRQKHGPFALPCRQQYVQVFGGKVRAPA